MAKRRMKYNPSFLTEAELIESFVVRHADLELIIGILGENVTDSNQHVLVIGPRGSGKTTLVHRVAAEIKQHKELRDRWYPLIFSEESYEVVSAGEFWLEALFHLAEQANDEKWKRTYAELKGEGDEQRLADRALAQLLDFADSQGKRILLIVENLNMLLGDLTSDDEAWKIRHTLINEPRLMLLATATNRFEHIENSSQAMFEMFKMQELKPLDDEECNRIWELITGQGLLGERIRPVRILTGGTPRLLTIIAKFSAHRSFRALLDELVDLIDDHTEYFKSHLDNLPAIERKVYLALAGLWDASTAREIAQAARLDVNKTSSLLARLIGRGAVVVEESGKKTKWYVVAERMYNIYYLMRRRGKPADRVKATVKFMVSMYDPESAARLITEEACRLSPEVCHDHYLAFEETIKEVQESQLREKIIAATPKSFLESPYLSEKLRNFTAVDKGSVPTGEYSDKENIEVDEALTIIEQGIKLAEEKKHEQVIEYCNEVIRKFESINKPLFLQIIAISLLLKGAMLYFLGKLDEAIAVYDEVISRIADAKGEAFHKFVAKAMVYKGVTLGQLNRPEEAIAVYDEVIARFADVEEPILREQVANALTNKGITLDRLNRHAEAEKAFRQAIAFGPDATWRNTINLIALLLKMPGRLADALQTAEGIIASRPADAQLLNSVAWAFYKQRDLSLLPKAETWARQAVSLAPENATTHHTLACILSALGKGDEALESARRYLQDTSLLARTIEDAIQLFVELAAAGQAAEALELLTNTPAEPPLEPLVVGLKLYLGMEVKTAPEIREVAKDVVKRIEELVQKRGCTE